MLVVTPKCRLHYEVPCTVQHLRFPSRERPGLIRSLLTSGALWPPIPQMLYEPGSVSVPEELMGVHGRGFRCTCCGLAWWLARVSALCSEVSHKGCGDRCLPHLNHALDCAHTDAAQRIAQQRHMLQEFRGACIEIHKPKRCNFEECIQDSACILHAGPFIVQEEGTAQESAAIPTIFCCQSLAGSILDKGSKCGLHSTGQCQFPGKKAEGRKKRKREGRPSRPAGRMSCSRVAAVPTTSVPSAFLIGLIDQQPLKRLRMSCSNTPIFKSSSRSWAPLVALHKDAPKPNSCFYSLLIYYTYIYLNSRPFLPWARCVCRVQAACRGCQDPSPYWIRARPHQPSVRCSAFAPPPPAGAKSKTCPLPLDKE